VVQWCAVPVQQVLLQPLAILLPLQQVIGQWQEVQHNAVEVVVMAEEVQP